MHPLKQLGLSQQAVNAYQTLLDRGALPEHELDETAVRQLLGHGLVTVVEGVVNPESPRRFLEPWLERREAELRADRDRAEDFLRSYHRRPGGGQGAIEMLSGRESVAALFFELLDTAREEVLGLDRAPYSVSPPSPSDRQTSAITRGVHFRVIYEGESLRQMGDASFLHACLAAGEEVRVLQRLPMKMIVTDRSRAMIALPGQGGGSEAVLVRAPLPVDGLLTLFEQLWDLALPVHQQSTQELPVTPADADEGTRALLTLMSLGVTDEAIARDLGISLRTLQRRVAQLQRSAGVATRFQLGVQAARLGWF